MQGGSTHIGAVRRAEINNSGHRSACADSCCSLIQELRVVSGLDEEELADWRTAGCNAIYQLAAVGATVRSVREGVIMQSITVKREDGKKGGHPKVAAKPELVWCNLLLLLSDNGEFSQYQALNYGCIKVNLFNPDGSFASSLDQNVVKGQIVNIEDPHSFDCQCG
jgi:hypothetical protein